MQVIITAVVAGTEMHDSPSSQGTINGQNSTIGIFVLNWLKDLLVSNFLGVIAKKKVLYFLWILVKLFFVLFFKSNFWEQRAEEK